jgi:F0F1-type ATP synthase delta subunit
MFAKPLTQGTSKYPLSDEEKQAIAAALAKQGGVF